VKAGGAALLLLLGGLGAIAGAASPQEKPLRRSFQAGAVESYRVEISVRTEIRGVRAEMIGANAYVKPFVQAAEGTLRWTAVRRTASVSADGIAELVESLDRPNGDCPAAISPEEYSAELRAEIEKFCQAWKQPRVVRYREAADGSIHGFPANDTPHFEDTGCSMLSSWSRHALRPSAILPPEPLRIGDKHERKSHPTVAPWNSGEGSETTEWLSASGAGVNLRVVQQLSNQDHSVTNAKNPGPAKILERNTFFAESLSTLSTLDASLSGATRSASCETLRTLEAVAGLPQPPQFTSKLSVTVTIHRIP
jgi:hypothetical protein